MSENNDRCLNDPDHERVPDGDADVALPGDAAAPTDRSGLRQFSPLDLADQQKLKRRYAIRWLLGLLILGLLAGPSMVHSAAAIATLRNVPDRWLPANLPLKEDFDQFFYRFNIADTIFISWPDAKLGGDDVDQVTMLLRGLSTELSSASESAVPTEPSLKRFDDDAVPPPVQAFWESAMDLCKDLKPIIWVRSGTEVRDALTVRPLNLTPHAAAKRLQGTLVGPDQEQTCVVVSFAVTSGDHQRILLPMMRKAIAESIDRPVSQIVMVGGAVDGAAVDTEAVRSIEKYTVPSSVLAALLCWVCLRSIPLTFTILGIATVGQGMVLAVVYYMGTPMNAILIVLPPLVFVLTVSSGIHLSNYFFDIVRVTQCDGVTGAQHAMRIGVPPCLTAAFTTVVGLMSLCLVRLEPVRTFGIIGSIGVLSTLGLLLIMLPGAMVDSKRFAKKTKTPQSGDTNTRAGKRSAWWLRPAWILSLFAVVSSLAVMGLGRLTTSVSVPKMFLPESELRQNYEWYEKHVGATMTAELLMTFDDESNQSNLAADEPKAVKQRDRDAIDQLHDVLRVQSALVQLDEVGGVFSAANLLPMASRSGGLAATVSRSVVRAQLQDEQSEIHTLGYLDHSRGQRSWRLSLRLFQTGENDFANAIGLINQTAHDALSDKKSNTPSPTITMTGHVVIVEGTQQLLLADLFTSFLTAFGVIAILMAIYLRSVMGGLLAMIPNLIPTLILFGSMGWLRSPLDIGSVMTASVALGIAVDDSVHLLSQYRLARQTDADRKSAAVTALHHCGWAMMQTTLVCSISLLVYGLSPFVPTRRFAFFMLGLLALAWIGVATLLPAIMATRFGDRFARKKKLEARKL